MLFMPKNLACLASIAPKESARYAASVRIVDKGDGKYMAEATDGKVLARVEGQTNTREVSSLASAPNGATEGLIGPKDFLGAFKGARKGESVPAVLSNRVTTFATPSGAVVQTANVEGRFPNTQAVIDDLASEVVLSVSFDGNLLAKLLECAATFADHGTDANRVTLEFRANRHVGRNSIAPTPVKVIAGNNEQSFTGLIVPLSPASK